MTDMNRAKAKQEDEQLRAVDELEQNAMSLLCDGDVALQKLWCGRKDRALAAAEKIRRLKRRRRRSNEGTSDDDAPRRRLRDACSCAWLFYKPLCKPSPVDSNI